MDPSTKRSSAITNDKAQQSASVLDKEAEAKKQTDKSPRKEVVDVSDDEGKHVSATQLFGIDDDSDESDKDFDVDEVDDDSDGDGGYSDAEVIDIKKLPPKMQKIVEESKKADAKVLDLDAIGADDDEDEDAEDDEDEDEDDDSMLGDENESEEQSDKDDDFLLRNAGEGDDDEDDDSMVADDLEAMSEDDEDGKGRRRSPLRKMFQNVVQHHVYQFYSRYDDIMKKNLKSDDKARKNFEKCAEDAKKFRTLRARMRDTVMQTVNNTQMIYILIALSKAKRLEVYELDSIFATEAAAAEADPQVPRCVITDRKFEKSGPFMGNLVSAITLGNNGIREQRMYYMSKIAASFVLALFVIENFSACLDRHIAKKLSQYLNEYPNLPPTHYVNKYLDDDLIDNVGTLYEVFSKCRRAICTGLKVPDYFEPQNRADPETCG